MKKIGIFAGTFDPIHNGHITFAKQTLSQTGLDKIFFLIEPRPRRKQGVRALEHRTNMVELAIKGEPAFGMIVLEQARFSVNETLPALQNRFKGAELYMMLGEDVLQHLTEWPHVADLLKSVHFIIGARNRSLSSLTKHVKNIVKTRGIPFRYEIISTPDFGLSSSQVRLSVRKNKTDKQLDVDVANYIEKHHLYHA